MNKQNKLFEYNLPLQACRDDNGKITLLNYMPRKGTVCHIPLSEFGDGGEDEKEILYGAATNLVNLAILLKEFADKKRDSVYYHDEDIEKHFPPLTYAFICKELDKYAISFKKEEDV